MAIKKNPIGTRNVGGGEQKAREFIAKAEGQTSKEVGVRLTKGSKDDHDTILKVGDRPAPRILQKTGNLVGKVLLMGSGIPEAQLDGRIVGGDRQLYPSSTSMRKTPPVVAKDRRDPKTGLAKEQVEPDMRVDVIEVNGIMTKAQTQLDSMEKLADTLSPGEGLEGPQPEVRGVHNGTDGFVRDLSQCVKDKVEFGHNAAVATLRNKILDRVSTGMPVNLLAHSQGGLVTARALSEVRIALQEGLGLTREHTLELLSKTVNVLTCGAAAWQYPSGPNYVHIVNKRDPIPMVVGAGVEFPDTPLGRIGRLLAKGAHKLRTYNPLASNRHGSPFYFGATDKTPNIASVEGIVHGHKYKQIMANHSIDGPYNEWISDNKGRLMGEFFKTADKTVPKEALAKLGLSEAVDP